MSYCGHSLKGSENENVVAAQWLSSQLRYVGSLKLKKWRLQKIILN